MLRIIVDNVPLRYPDKAEDLNQQLRSFKDYLDHFQQSRAKMDTISHAYSNGSIMLIQGDLQFEAGRHKDAIPFYNQAFDFFQQALRVQTDRPGDQGKVTPKLKYELERRSIYAQCRITHAEALILLKEADKDTRAKVLDMLQLTAQSYKEEIKFEESDFYHTTMTLRSLLLVHVRISEIQSEIAADFFERRKNLYVMLSNSLKANFLGANVPQAFFERLRTRIKKMTLEKFQDRADQLWATGLSLSNEKRYEMASQLFFRGSTLYSKMQRLEPNVEFRVQGEIMYVAGLEHEGRACIEIDENSLATQKFEQAQVLLRKLLTTVREMGNVDLARHFTVQQQYFDGMIRFSSGIIAYDTGNHSDAQKQLIGAKRVLNQVMKAAQELGNSALQSSCKEGIAKTETYLETLSVLGGGDANAPSEKVDSEQKIT